MVEIVVRLVCSLAVVVGLLLLLAKLTQRRFAGPADALVTVVHRRPLSRAAAVSVVTVGERVLVLGTTEQQVTVLAELSADELALASGTTPAAVAPDTAERPAEAAEAAGLVLVPGGRHRADLPSEELPELPDEAAAVVLPSGALAGSLVSGQTWRQAWAAATAAGRSRDVS